MFNEAASAARCVRGVDQVLSTLTVRSALVAVDDGSTDRTPEILAGLAAECPRLTVVRHRKNRGYGRAILTGAEEARRRGLAYALFMDCDLTNDPKYIPAFVERMRDGADLVKGSRYVHGGGMVGVPPHRVAISVVGNRLAARLLGVPVTDCTNGFRAVRLDLLARMRLHEPGFPVIMEELYQARWLGAAFAEVPYVLTSRSAEQGGSRFRYRPAVFARHLRYPLRACFGVAPSLGAPGADR
jgi:glycosyltransferase involved in cell wall biosynthesis